MSAKAKSLLGVAMLGIFPIMADICGLELPKWARFGLFHAFTLGCIFLVLAIIVDHLQDWNLLAKPRKRNEMTAVVLCGAILGALLAPVIWQSLKSDEARDSGGLLTSPPIDGVAERSNTPERNGPFLGDEIDL